ncbi:MAG TPA: tetratricopeptide repeat protein [bacterium]|nr:tetratricopeptide repeat protein [bacterium]HPQ66402.1 tetratricopeptide repeat protein [bacterium]
MRTDRFRWTAAAAGVLLAAGCGERSDRFYGQGLDDAREGRYDQAAISFRSQIQADPEDLRGHLALAAVYRARNEYSPALDELEKALALDETAPEPAYCLGTLYQEMEKPEQARARFLEALERDPDYTPALYRLGVLAREGGDLDAAAGYFRNFLEAGPEEKGYGFNNLGAVLWEQGDRAGALEAFAAALAADPAPPAAGYNYGVAAFALETDREGAVAALEEYAGREPPPPERAMVRVLLERHGVKDSASVDEEFSSPQDAVEKGLVRESRGEYREAEEAYLFALDAAPDGLQALYRLGLLYDDRLGDRRRAVEMYERFLDVNRNPQSDLVAEVVRRLGAARRELGEEVLEGSGDVFRTPPPVAGAAASPPGAPSPTPARDRDGWVEAGLEAEAAGRYAAALKAFEAARAEDPGSSEIGFALGRVHQSMGRYAEARPYLEAALEGGESDARVRLAEVYLKLAEIEDDAGRPAAAAEYYRLAEKTGASGTREKLLETYRKLYRACLAEGDASGAARALERSVALDPSRAGDYLALGDLYYDRLQEEDRAREAYRRYLKLEPRTAEAERVRARLSPRRQLPASTPVPKDEAASLYSRGAVLQKAGRTAEAEKAYWAAVAADPSLYQAYYNLGVLENGRNRPQAALENFLRVVELQPRFAPAHLALFKLYHYHFHDDVSARRHASAYVELEPRGPQTEALQTWLRR